MHLTVRRAGIAAIAGLALLPLGSAHAMRGPSSSAVLLRYHFVAGQSYAYYITSQMQIVTGNSAGGSLAALGLAAVLGDMGTTTTSGIVRYRILRVDASGGADVSVSTSKVTKTVTKDGQSTTTPGASQPAYTVHVNADGSQQGTPNLDMGAFGLGVTGTFPAASVAPGAQWTTTATINAPDDLSAGAPPIRVPIQYTFSKYLTADGQHSAAIDGKATVQYGFDLTTQNGLPLHIQLNGPMAGHSVFGLTMHRLISDQTTIDLELSLGKHRRHALTGANPHIHMTITMQPQGW